MTRFAKLIVRGVVLAIAVPTVAIGFAYANARGWLYTDGGA